jgi:hypothetical protein
LSEITEEPVILPSKKSNSEEKLLVDKKILEIEEKHYSALQNLQQSLETRLIEMKDHLVKEQVGHTQKIHQLD